MVEEKKKESIIDNVRIGNGNEKSWQTIKIEGKSEIGRINLPSLLCEDNSEYTTWYSDFNAYSTILNLMNLSIKSQHTRFNAIIGIGDSGAALVTNIKTERGVRKQNTEYYYMFKWLYWYV